MLKNFVVYVQLLFNPVIKIVKDCWNESTLYGGDQSSILVKDQKKMLNNSFNKYLTEKLTSIGLNTRPRKKKDAQL